jgi:uncharacterized protein (DUF342 family)
VCGDEVVAAIGGRPTLAGDVRVEVVPLFEVRQDLDYAVGNIEFAGDVIVRGDVRPGFSIAAGGSVVVQGLVEGAQITAGGDLSVLGAAGEHGSVFDVGGDLVARYLHSVVARVRGTAAVSLEIVNCTLSAERVSTSSRGRIVGGSVIATAEIDAGSLGSHSRRYTEVRVTSGTSGAVVRARTLAYPGVTLQIGSAHRRLMDALPSASFWCVAGTIITLKSTANEGEARVTAEHGGEAAS